MGTKGVPTAVPGAVSEEPRRPVRAERLWVGRDLPTDSDGRGGVQRFGRSNVTRAGPAVRPCAGRKVPKVASAKLPHRKA